MRLLALLAAGLFAGTLLAADDKKDEKKVKDEEAILGAWKAEKVDIGSDKEAPADLVAKFRFTFKKDGKVEVAIPSGTVSEGTFKLDPTAKLKTIDMTKEGVITPGVYDLDGDTLKICMNDGNGKTRPTEFKGSSGVYFFTFKRVKDEKKEEKKDK